MVSAVSYTHLDVYKRQGFLMSEKFRYTLDFSGTPGLGWDGMLIALLGGHNPVSYTHLDVYKRQDQQASKYAPKNLLPCKRTKVLKNRLY